MNWIVLLPKLLRDQALRKLTNKDAAELENDWRWYLSQARPEQKPPPGDWRVWLLLAGRGFGKTRTGAEFVRACAEFGLARRIALVAPTALDVRNVMVEGESGILAIGPPKERPDYEPSLHRLTWPNGAVATLFSADEPNRLRGPQHDLAWCDELAAWRYPAAWDMLMFGLRLGEDPRVVVTTTPRPIKLVRELLADPKVVVTRGRTIENREHLAPAFLEQIVRRYEGTRLGRQELRRRDPRRHAGRLVEPRPDRCGPRFGGAGPHPPRTDADRRRDRSGGQLRRAQRRDRHHRRRQKQRGSRLCAVRSLGPLPSGRMGQGGDQRVPGASRRPHRRRSQHGGEMVEATLRMIDPNVPYAAVHAARGKVARAGPVAALYEQGRIHHLGALPQLEDQMCAFTSDFDRDAAGYSPDRVDALVWALSELFVEPIAGAGMYEAYRRVAQEQPTE
jgi:phage terminase large subunit-like protein